MAITITGQELFDMAMNNLGGYQNAVKPDRLLQFLNEGKDELWMLLKNLREDYFLQSSDFSDAAANNYFAALTTNAREFTLPPDFREMKTIEVVSPVGLEGTVFTQIDMAHPVFQDARRAASLDRGTGGISNYLYDIVGRNTMMFAQFPAVAFQLKLWYVRWIVNFDLNDTVDEILLPYTNKIADYAAQKAMITLTDAAKLDPFIKQWRKEALNTESSASPRQIGSAEFVTDFLG